MVNQIRICPGCVTTEVIDCSRSLGMVLEGYSPFGTGRIFRIPELVQIAGKYHKTVAQICLRWGVQMGFVLLPKSITPARIRENADIFDFELSEEDLNTLTHLKGEVGTPTDPDHIDF